MNDLSQKITFRLDQSTIESLDAIVAEMNRRSSFHVSHTRSDALRYCVRFAVEGLVRKRKEEPSSGS